MEIHFRESYEDKIGVDFTFGRNTTVSEEVTSKDLVKFAFEILHETHLNTVNEVFEEMFVDKMIDNFPRLWCKIKDQK